MPITAYICHVVAGNAGDLPVTTLAWRRPVRPIRTRRDAGA